MRMQFLTVLVVVMSTNAAKVLANHASLKEWGSVHLQSKNSAAHVAKTKLESVFSRSPPRLYLRCCGSERMVLRGGGRKPRNSEDNNESKRKHISGPDESDSGDAIDESDSDSMTGADSQDMNEPGGESNGHERKSQNDVSSAEVHAKNKAFDRKLDAYARKYGLSTGQPANPLGMLLEKAARSMDAKTRFKIKKENFALQAKEMDAIKRQLKEDDARRPCRRMERRERRGLEHRLHRLLQLQGELKKEEKDLATKAEYNREQRARIARGQRPYLVRDITRKKFAKKFDWRRPAPARPPAERAPAAAE